MSDNKNLDDELDYNIVFNDQVADEDFFIASEEENNNAEHECCAEDCECEHHHEHNNKQIVEHKSQENSSTEEASKLRGEEIIKKYGTFMFEEAGDDTCELDPKKVCDNCGRCLGNFNTDERGYVQIGIDKVDKSNTSLNEIYKMYNLDEDDN